MGKKSFIEWLIVKYMSNADEKQAEVGFNDLESILPEHIDFEYLRQAILTNYDKRTMPDYNFMKNYFRKKTASSLDNKWTPTTWNIFGKTKTGYVYSFANYMGVSEYEGREILLKAHPELVYAGNDRELVLKSLYENE